jgi:hypothetical protein
MRRIICVSCWLFLVASISLVVLPGCTNPAGDKGGKDAGKDKDKGAHADPPAGPHGGPYAEWGTVLGVDCHVEFTVDPKTKQVTLYVLDEHCKNSAKLDPKKITKMKLTITKPAPLFSIELTYDAEKSKDNKGLAFVGTHDRFGEQADFKGTIDAKVEGAKDPSGEFPNPNYKKSARLRELYLKPGGIYTEADIKANGNTTPVEKFAGKIFKHSKDVKPGDKICPITDQKANAECAWIVNGQRYEFCCQPCVDDFIVMAHDDEEKLKIKPAKEYVQKGN